MILQALLLVFLFIFSPSYLFASQTEQGARVESPSGGLSETKTSGGDKAQAEGTAVPPRTEMSVSEPESKDQMMSMSPYDSNPVATKAIDRNISLFTQRIKERFSLYLQRSGKYLELMKEILKTYNIPEDIAFLPLIESGFNPQAYSVARAVGPWQFIAGTAKKYGLKVDWWRDERKDPVKSTAAAASYLSDLYSMFGSWNLAMAAYNAGEGKILRALNRTKSDDYWELLNTRHIKRETKEYVPRFIAAKLIATNPRLYGFDNLDYHPPFEYDEIVIERPLDLDVVARCAETSLDSIKDLNPEIRRWSTPANVSPYTLRIPFGKKGIFMENLARIPEEERFSVTEYKVKKGDTLKKISNRTGIPAAVIIELNNQGGELKPFNVGDTVYLPPKEKFQTDRDDRREAKKASLKGRRGKGKKIVVTALEKKQTFVND